jgi:hypothetical protein
MEDTEEFNDIELEETRESYPQYDDMNYHDFLSNFDELTNRFQREVKYGSDPLVATDLNSELNYVKKLMEELGTAQTTFTEGEERTVNITGPSGSTTVPSVNFVEDSNDLLPDVLEASTDSLNVDWEEINNRLSKMSRLTVDNKMDFKNQWERVQAVTRVVQSKEKISLDPRNKYVRELIKRSSFKTLNDGTEVLMFRSEQGINKSGIQIMKRGKANIPTYSKNSPALREYRELVRKIKEEPPTSINEGDDESEITVVDRGADLNDLMMRTTHLKTLNS